MSRGKMWAIRAAAFVAAILIGAVIFLLIGNNPVSAYGTILTGSLGKKTAIRQTVRIAIPLLGTALAIAPCFKMKFWNIGAEGQITAGAIGAAWFALFWADRLPGPMLLVVMAVAGALFGGVWALIPAFFKTRWGTNETLFTLMMNYIAIGIVNWLQGGPWEGRPGSQIIPQFDSAAVLPKVLGVHCGWIIVLALTVLMYFYMKYTKQGYEIAVVGESENTARYAGMNVGRIVMRTMFLSTPAWPPGWASPPSPWRGWPSSTPSPWWPSPCSWRCWRRAPPPSRPRCRCRPPSPTSSPASSSSACWAVSSSSITR